MAHISRPLRRRRARRFHTSRSASAASVALTVGGFVALQWLLLDVTPEAGVADGVVGATVAGALLWFTWRCGARAGLHLGRAELRVEQLVHSWVLSPDRVVRVSLDRGLNVVTSTRSITVFGLPSWRSPDWSGGSTVRRAAKAVRDWRETTPVSDGGGVERWSVRWALRDLVVVETAMVGVYALGQLAVALGWF
ncbi:hypothetical protein [Quadrisphaera granulorum]|uniref:hypothetical protein n=1 Tax=Quadrisphaera granulorum TaxID=317664 RepID=UPI0011B53E1F|nr:hypothetical protein [Quadrisphaera granulorum]